jgi:hypothetical protein
VDGNIDWAFGWLVGEEIGGFHGDIYGRPAEACKWAKGSDNGVDGVTAGVREGQFGMIAGAEKVVTVLVKRLVARAFVVVGVVRD